MRTVVTSRGVNWLCAGAIVAAGVSASACRGPAAPVDVDPASIGGVVLNGGRPEAGVWVIAETTGLPTHFSRIVVTDDDGRFLVPDLPESASYDVWVRGYGLRDSQPVKAARGERVSLQVENAQTPQEAARIYPANYWLSLYQPPPVQRPSVGRLRGPAPRRCRAPGNGTRKRGRRRDATRDVSTGSAR